jgi:O-antigen ligase
MFAGLFFSRVLLSSGMVLFVCFVIVEWLNNNDKEKPITNKTFLFSALLFLFPLLSGLWSSNTQEWWHRAVVKIPLLIIPLAWLLCKPFNKDVYYKLSSFFILLIGATSFWSFAKYAGNSIPVQDGYSKAAVMLVPFDNDRIRYSWAVVIAIMLSAKLIQGFVKRRAEKYFFAALIIWLIIYLHILAAKTGLVTFYATFFIYCTYKFFTVKNKWLPFACLVLPVVMFLLAYWLLPTFHNRVHYVWWDFQQYSNNLFTPSTSDGMRIESWKAGANIFTGHIVSGVGFGDIKTQMHNWYSTNLGVLNEHDKIFPNQLLMYAAGAGILGLLVFIAASFFPFFSKEERKNILWHCFFAASLICFLTDIPLEGQYGVFLYCFFAGWYKQGMVQ